jgi:hypothetical protein
MPSTGIYQKIAKIMSEINYLQTDKTIKLKSGDTYNVISSVKVFTIIRQKLKENNLVFIPKRCLANPMLQGALHATNGDVKVGSTVLTTINLSIEIVDTETGECCSVEGSGQGSDTQDKGASKAVTNAYKNIMQKLFLIPIGDDPDEYDSDDLDEEIKRKASSQTTPQPKKEEQPSERLTEQLIGAVLTEFQLNTNKDTSECRKLFINQINGCQRLSEVPTDQYKTLINMVAQYYATSTLKCKTPSLDRAIGISKE